MSLRMQPTFRLNLPADADQTSARLRAALADADLAGHAKAAGRCLDFQVDPEARRFWSPHLSVQVSDTEAGAELFGRFAPRPDVWTMFMMVYFAAVFVVVAGAIYACVQVMLGQSPWALLALAPAVLVIAALHVLSFVGQRLSAEQMVTLRQRLDRTLEIAFAGDPNERTSHPASAVPPEN